MHHYKEQACVELAMSLFEILKQKVSDLQFLLTQKMDKRGAKKVFDLAIELMRLHTKKEVNDTWTDVMSECLSYFEQEELASEILPLAIQFSDPIENLTTRRISASLIGCLSKHLCGQHGALYRSKALPLVFRNLGDFNYDLRKLVCSWIESILVNQFSGRKEPLNLPSQEEEKVEVTSSCSSISEEDEDWRPFTAERQKLLTHGLLELIDDEENLVKLESIPILANCLHIYKVEELLGCSKLFPALQSLLSEQNAEM